jgi:stringent starvation protein B
MSEISTKPYMLRAIYEWCTDSGYTPYIAVKVNQFCQVPQAFVKNNEIILNISFGATKGLRLDNEYISFSARFGGVAREIYVPMENVMAIYASENGQGMAFDVQLPADAPSPAVAPAAVPAVAPAVVPTVVPTVAHAAAPATNGSPAPVTAESESMVSTNETPSDPEPPKKSGKPTLTRIK